MNHEIRYLMQTMKTSFSIGINNVYKQHAKIHIEEYSEPTEKYMPASPRYPKRNIPRVDYSGMA
jgi:hypothetical protein